MRNAITDRRPCHLKRTRTSKEAFPEQPPIVSARTEAAKQQLAQLFVLTNAHGEVSDTRYAKQLRANKLSDVLSQLEP